MSEAKEKDTKWVVFWTLSGREQKVKKILENFVNEKKLHDKIKQILIPTETKIRVMKDGRRIVTETPLFRGYVLVELVDDPELIVMLQNYAGLKPLLARDPSKGEIPTLKKEEVERLLNTIREEQERKKAESPFMPGDKVKIMAGPFENFIGVVDQVFTDRGKLSVIVTIFGRATKVHDLSFDMVERVRT